MKKLNRIFFLGGVPLAVVGALAWNLVLPLSNRASAAGTCQNLQAGENNPNFTNTNVSYDTAFTSGIQYVGRQKVVVSFKGSGICDAPGSRFVRAEALLFDGSGIVSAFLEKQTADGKSAQLTGTNVSKNPSSFFYPVYSNIWNATGLTVRACGNFNTSGISKTICTGWTKVPN